MVASVPLNVPQFYQENRPHRNYIALLNTSLLKQCFSVILFSTRESVRELFEILAPIIFKFVINAFLVYKFGREES
jgi:hypothetical protein